MSTSALTHPNTIHVRNGVVIGLTAILILTSLVLIDSVILTIVSSTTKGQDAIQADPILVVQNSITPIPVPIPPTAENQPPPSEIPAPVTIKTSEPSVLAVPVPTPL
jgi:hypothetical protein